MLQCSTLLSKLHFILNFKVFVILVLINLYKMFLEIAYISRLVDRKYEFYIGDISKYRHDFIVGVMNA